MPTLASSGEPPSLGVAKRHQNDLALARQRDPVDSNTFGPAHEPACLAKGLEGVDGQVKNASYQTLAPGAGSI